MISSDLFLDALSLDLGSMEWLIGFEPTAVQWVFAVFAHAAACALVATLLYRLLPRHARQSRLSGMGFIFSVLFFIPVIGAGGLLATLTAMRRRDLKPKAERLIEVPLPSFRLDIMARRATKASGRPLAQLNDACASAGPRIQALVALQAMPFRLVSPILRRVLDDPVEDIRLLAYGLLDSREKRINEAIHRERMALSSSDSGLALALRCKRLAQLYWELIHQELAQNDLRQHARTQSSNYAREALGHMPDDAGLWVLLGKLSRDDGQLEAASAHFERALELGYPEKRLLPYLAEAAYRQRDWPRVRELLLRLGGMENQPRVASVSAFWAGKRPPTRGTSSALASAQRPSSLFISDMDAGRWVRLGDSAYAEGGERDE